LTLYKHTSLVSKIIYNYWFDSKKEKKVIKKTKLHLQCMCVHTNSVIQI